MGLKPTLIVFLAVLLLSFAPLGRCFVTGLMDSISKTSAKARDSVADVGHAGIQAVVTGTKGIHNMVKFGTDTVSDYHSSTLGSLVNGNRKTGELLDDGMESLVDLGSRIGVQVRSTAVIGSRMATRHSLDFAKSGVDLLNRISSGTTSTLRTAVQEGGKGLKALPRIPIITPLIELPYKMADDTLGALTEMSDDTAENTKSILDKMRPDDDDYQTW